MILACFDSIHKRLALAVTAGSLAFAIVVGLVSFLIEYRRQQDEAMMLQDQLVATVRSSAAVGAFAGNREISAEVVEGLLANPVIQGVRIESTQGFAYEQQRQHTGGQAVEYRLYSPMDPRTPIGRLMVWQTESEVNRQAQAAALRYSVLLMLQILISAGFLMALFGRVVGQPLARVARELESVQPGGSQRIPLPPGHEFNEIGMLVRSGNSLLGAVEAAIIEERRLQAEVDEMEAHYRRIFETTNVGVMILKPGGKLVDCNTTLLTRIVGTSLDDNRPGNSDDFIEAVFSSPEKVWRLIWEAGESGQSVAGDLQLRSDDGRERWAHCMLSVTRDPQGEIDLIEGVLYDVTARRLHEDEMLRNARIDPLTGLGNRRAMEAFLDESLAMARMRHAVLGLILIDLDGFKSINDTYGHLAGDQVLKTIGARLSGSLRQNEDLVCRLGGDEFTVITGSGNSRLETLENLAGDLIELICEPITLDNDLTVSVGASLGIASFPEHGHDRGQLLEAADFAMYQVKRAGKNAYAFARPLRPAGEMNT